MSSRVTIVILLMALSAAKAFAKLPITHTSKLSSGIKIEIERRTDVIQPNVSFTLESILNVPQPYDKTLRLQWILPPGIDLVSGQMESLLSNLSPQEPKKIQVALVSDSAENKIIRVKVFKGSALLATASYHTVNQDQHEEQKRTLIERGKRYLLENPEVLKKSKIHH